MRDREQTISFLAPPAIADRLVAGCAANPTTVGELLLATEVFQRGIASNVMASLMEFDKALHRLGPASAYEVIMATKGEGTVQNAFQVVDNQTEVAAFLAVDRGLIILDLRARTIRASENLQVMASGEILAHSGDELSDRAITYILPQEWSVETL